MIARRVGFHPTDDSRSVAVFSGVVVGWNPTLRLQDTQCAMSGGDGAL